MKTIVFIAFTSSVLVSLFGTPQNLKPIDQTSERTCCARYANNGQVGEDHLTIRVSSCVSFDAAAETLGNAHDRACEKAQKKARTLVEN